MSQFRKEAWSMKYNFERNYEIQDEIGRGSFATVRRGYNLKTNEQVAVKIIHKNKLEGKIKQSMEDEIMILKKLKHPNIVSLIEVERRDNEILIIMELCALGDLSDYIKKGKKQIGTKGPGGGLNEIIFRHFLKQLASAFRFLRKNSLIHRDLKPQNILLSPPKEELFNHDSTEASNLINSLPQLKVGDFGFAKYLPTQSMTDTVCGSPLYMAPEVLLGFSYDASADLWSIGAVLYEMITGGPPFSAKGTSDLLRVIKNGKNIINFPGEKLTDNVTSFTRPRQTIPEDIKSLIRSLLIQEPENRISFSNFFEHPAVQRTIIEPPPIINEELFSIRRPDNKEMEQASYSHLIDFAGSNLRKSSSLSFLNGDNKKDKAVTDKRMPTHLRTNSNLSNEIHLRQEKINEQEDEDFDNDYVLIETENDLRNLKINSSEAQKRSNPVRIQNQNGVRKFSNGDTLNSGSPKEINEKESVPRFIPGSNGKNEGSNPENGWTVGSNAATALAKAISLASLKLFGSKGLSPPNAQYRSDSDKVFFPLSYEPSNSSEEKALKEVQQLACQSYSVVSIADIKLEKLKLKNSESSDGQKQKNNSEPQDSEANLGTGKLAYEAYLLYSKSLSMLEEAYEKMTDYWKEIINPKNEKRKPNPPRLTERVDWLNVKIKDCMEKIEFIQPFLDEDSLKTKNTNTDKLILKHACEVGREAAVREMVNDDSRSNESSFRTAIWMLQAIQFRTPQDGALSPEDLLKVETTLKKFEQLELLRKKE
ncbi:kinase-like protein [Neoconidiobolus thromboides FSU 785]|nr:kinase-like protein [Neoconidiobolus thromboides FSU 785]